MRKITWVMIKNIKSESYYTNDELNPKKQGGN